jgi:hypothetical protein
MLESWLSALVSRTDDRTDAEFPTNVSTLSDLLRSNLTPLHTAVLAEQLR